MYFIGKTSAYTHPFRQRNINSFMHFINTTQTFSCIPHSLNNQPESTNKNFPSN